MSSVLQLDSISKSFSGIPVLRSINLGLGSGEILGLVGENGAGKSTLINILGGILRADSGTIRLGDLPYQPTTPRDALRNGIGIVHQELNLFPNLSIAENLYLDCLPQTGPLIDKSELVRNAANLQQRVGLNIHPSTLVERLSSGERQLVELARALAHDCKILLLDEPTSSLSHRERERFFQLIHELASEGRSIVFVSHAINDVIQHCHRIIVLRDGAIAAIERTESLDSSTIVSKMVGVDKASVRFNRNSNASPVSDNRVMLAVRGLSQPNTVENISFDLHAEEIVGVYGLVGAGRSELARILFGLDGKREGEILLDGQSLRGGPSQRIQQGMAFLTENRRHDGICGDASVAENLSLVALRDYSKGIIGTIDQTRLTKANSMISEAVQLQSTVRPSQPVRTLSGGNQQKIVLGKWLLKEPKVLVLDEPTRGIDVAAKAEIYGLIDGMAKNGSGVLMISSELDELLLVCDRILVMSLGRITGDFRRDLWDRESILVAALAYHARNEASRNEASHAVRLDVPSSASTQGSMHRSESGRMGDALSWLLENSAWLLLLAVWLTFAACSNKFLTQSNLMNIGIQSSSTAILASAMTIVLLTGGVDLSVGAVMFISAAIAGKLAMAGFAMPGILCVMIGTGFLAGLVNGTIIVRLGIIPFIATLGTLYVGRGVGLWISETRAMNLPSEFLQLGAATCFYIPIPILVLLLVTLIGQMTLSRTSFGRYLMAIGYGKDLAIKAGVPVRRVLTCVYIVCGSLAALAAIVSLSLLGAVSPTFGENREFTAIAATVLGGTSLFGGRGAIFPNAILGALILSSVENGLVLINADPYLYPVVLSLTIFLAVLLDGGRTAFLESLRRRPIFHD